MVPGTAMIDGPAPLRVHLLGRLAIDDVDVGSLGSRKARSFLAVLALARGRVVGTDALIDDLWGTAAPAKPANQVSVLASRSRAALGIERIEHSAGGYRLVMDWLDLDEVDDLAEHAAVALTAGRAPSARAAAATARRLLAHPLLEDEPDAGWADDERRRLDNLGARLAAIAAEAELLGGDPAAAAALADQTLTRDPYDERALRILMRAHRGAGRPASALAAYARTRDLLREELGVGPTAETEALHTEILLGDEPGDDAGLTFRLPASAGPPHLGTTGRDGRGRVMAGRDEELQALDDAQHTVPSVGARIVAVTGEAGIGKSTLLRTWVARTRAAGTIVLTGAADPSEPGLPLQPVLDALAGHLSSVEPEMASALVAPDATVLAPLLGHHPAAPRLTPTGVDVVDAGMARQVLFNALVGVLERLAPPGDVVVLVIDDVDAAGAATEAWIRFARRRVLQGRLLMVVGSRLPGSPGDLPPADLRLELGPLGLDAAIQLVGADRAPELLVRSGGHPLFLVELADAHGDELPGSILDAVATRLRLAAEVAPVVEAAAVLGGPVDLDLLAGVLDAQTGAVLTSLELAVRQRFLDEDGTSFVFHHALVQQAAAARVRASRQAFLHRQAAHLLDRRPDGDPFAVAEHARLGGDPLLASRALMDASDRAAEAHDYGEAHRLLDEAVALDDSVEARRRRAVVSLCLGRFDDAVDDAEIATHRDPRPEVVEVAAWAAYYRRDFDRALRHAAWVARDPNAGPAAAAGHAVMGRILHARGELDQAVIHLRAGLDGAAPDQRAVTAVWLAGLHNHQGRAGQALELLRDVPPGMVMSQPFARVHGLFNLGYALAISGRIGDALGAFAQARVAVDTTGQSARYAAAVSNYQAWVLRYVGSLDEADDLNRSALEGTTFPEAQAQAMVDLVDGCLHRGDLDGAEQWLAEAGPLQTDDHAMRWRHALRARLLEARLALAREDHTEAQAVAAEVVAEATRLGLRRYEVLGRLTGQWAGVAAGDVIDLELLRGDLQALDGLAGLESWWWTAQLALVTGDDQIYSVAGVRVAGLASNAGDRGLALTAAAARLLDR